MKGKKFLLLGALFLVLLSSFGSAYYPTYYYENRPYAYNYDSYADKARTDYAEKNAVNSDNSQDESSNGRFASNYADSFTGRHRYSANQFSDNSQSFASAGKEKYSYSKGPCIAYTKIVNNAGKKNDYSVTEQFCDNQVVKASSEKSFANNVRFTDGFKFANSGAQDSSYGTSVKDLFDINFKSSGRFSQSNRNSFSSKQDYSNRNSGENYFSGFY